MNADDQHAVNLPHPSRTGPKTTGTCVCGWSVTYGWGGHRDAAEAASEHIMRDGGSQPVQMPWLNGHINVVEGLSL